MPPNLATCCSDEEIRRLRGFKAEVRSDLYYLEEVTKIPACTLSQYLNGRKRCPAHIADKIRLALQAWEKAAR